MAIKTKQAIQINPTMASTSKKTKEVKDKSKSNGVSHAPQIVEVNTGVSDKSRTGLITLLNGILANLSVLNTKTKNYHWNVVGMQFRSLHAFFEELYGSQAQNIDDVAERIKALGGTPLGTMAAFISTATLKEETRTGLAAEEMVASLLADYEAIIRQLRDKITQSGEKLSDDGTADFLTGLMENYEKTAWMLRSLLA